MEDTENYYKIVRTGDHYEKSSNLSFQLQNYNFSQYYIVKDKCKGLLEMKMIDAKEKKRKIDLGSGVQCQKNSINN
jgi:hypothetical protein